MFRLFYAQHPDGPVCVAYRSRIVPDRIISLCGRAAEETDDVTPEYVCRFCLKTEASWKANGMGSVSPDDSEPRPLV